MAKSQIQHFGIKVLIILLAISTIYGLALVTLQNDKSTEHIKPITTLKSALHQHYLALEGLKYIDTNDPAVAYKIDSVRKDIDKTREDLEKILGSEQNKQPVSDLINREKDLLSQYDTTYASFKKPLSYFMEDDLKDLKVSTQQSEINIRVDASIKALSKIKNENKSVSTYTSDKLTSVIDCLNVLHQTNEDKFAGQLALCNKSYRELRLNMALDTQYILTQATSKKLLEDYLKEVQNH
jgi:hypothetical protein